MADSEVRRGEEALEEWNEFQRQQEGPQEAGNEEDLQGPGDGVSENMRGPGSGVSPNMVP